MPGSACHTAVARGAGCPGPRPGPVRRCVRPGVERRLLRPPPSAGSPRSAAAGSGQLQPGRTAPADGLTAAGPAPPGVVRRVTATPGSSSATASAPEGGVGLDQLGQRHVPLDRVAHQAADHGVGLAERHALLDQPLGQVHGGHRRRRRPPPACGRCRRSPWPAGRPAPPGPDAIWSTESNRGSLSSCRSRL